MNPHRIRAKRGRPQDPAKHEALQSGSLFYAGKPCRKGHAGKRYASTGACVACYSVRPLVDVAGDEFAQMFD